MLLNQLCRTLTSKELPDLPESSKLRSQLVCPEYSKSVREIKKYRSFNKDLFAVCWNLETDHILYSALLPSEAPFSCRCGFRDEDKTQLHTHDYIELAYVVEGEFKQKILGRDIIFQEGDLCLIDKNCLHQDYLIGNRTIVLFLGLPNTMFDELMSETVSTEKVISFLRSALLKQKDLQQYLHFKPLDKAAGEMSSCLSSLLTELRDGGAGSDYICRGLMIRIFRLLSTSYEFSLSNEQKKAMNWIVFEELTDYIKEHFTTVAIQDLTEIFHFQEDYFNRLIKSKTGMTYSEYVQSFRLAEAERLLQSSDLTIDQIAEAAGYHNKGYFYKIFQEKHGMTPFQFRQKS